MHSSQIILALTLVAAVSPAVAAPLPAPGSKSDNTKFARAFTEEAGLQARAPASFGPLGKELLKGLAGGAGLSALFGGISALTGGNQKRELDERGIGSVIGKLVGGTDDALSTVIKNGAISGAAFGTSSSLSGGLLDKVFGREFDERSIGSVIGKLVGGTDDALSTVVKNGAISGAAFGTSSSLGGGFLDKVFGRDELEARAPISFGPLGKELLKGLAGGAGLSAVFGGISALTGGNQRRELGDNLTQEEADELERQLEAVMNDKSELSRRQGVAGAVAKSGLGSLIGKAIVGGLGSAVGGFGVDQIFKAFQGRDLGDNLTQEEADELEHQLQALMDNNKSGLSRRQGVAGAVAKSGLGSLIGKAVVGGLGSAIGGFGVDQIFKSFQGRDLGDNLTQEEADELERQLEQVMASQTPSKRELEARILPFIVGTIASTAGGFGIDKLLSKIKGRELGDNLTQEEADELERQLEAVMANQPASKRELEARINLGPLSKGLIGLGTSLGVSTVVGQGLDAVQGLFQREASLNDLD